MGRGETVEHDGAVEGLERRLRVGVRGTGVDDDGLAELARELELAGEEPLLRVVRRVLAEVVEADLADPDGFRALRECTDLVEVVLLARLVRVDADDGVDAVVLRRELDGLGRPDREDPGDAGRGRPRDGALVDQVEGRVRVDHRPRRSSSSCTVSGGSLRKSGFGSCSFWPGC